MQIQAVFVDRDGTMGGTGGWVHPRDFALYPGTMEAIRKLQGAGIKVFALTNQNRIARGQANLADFEREFRDMGLDGWYVCPHEPDHGCECHKPKPGMLLQAAKEHNLDLTQCAVIGDVGTDMLAADAVGAVKVLVRTGWGEGSLAEYRHIWVDVDPDYVASDLPAAVDWLLGKGARRSRP